MSLSVSRKRALRSFSDMRMSPVSVTCIVLTIQGDGAWFLIRESQGLKSKLEDTACTAWNSSARRKVLPSLDGEPPWHARQRKNAGTRRVRAATSRARCAAIRKERQRAGAAARVAK